MSEPQHPHQKASLVTVEPGYEGQRIDNFLITCLKGVPRTHVYRILRKGEVRVNKGRIKANYRIKAGDVVRIPPLRLPPKVQPPAPGQRVLDLLASAVVYEDKRLLVLNKPSGLAVHGGSGNGSWSWCTGWTAIRRVVCWWPGVAAPYARCMNLSGKTGSISAILPCLPGHGRGTRRGSRRRC
ncbi:MAG: hypothetical protein B0D85_05420 [Candidatus Sedimenticola endophacoides]|nr:MAG: hypothetical protein B0D85_05420 [Candidatus Sedimenticola endophacoides]